MRHDTNNELLSDAIRVIYVELSKLGGIIRKSVNDMTDMEKWALFLRYANILKYREIVNNIIESKGALQMAGSLLMSVSQDERERAVYRSRRMYQTDMQSNIATAEDRGIQIGRQEGAQTKALAIARNMFKRNRPIDEIIEDTGLTREEVENLDV
jgi:predicted transposase/invertase (TIGR01784 family)